MPLEEQVLADFHTPDSERTIEQIYGRVGAPSLAALQTELDVLVAQGRLAISYRVHSPWGDCSGLKEFATRTDIPPSMTDDWQEHAPRFDVREENIRQVYRLAPSSPVMGLKVRNGRQRAAATTWCQLAATILSHIPPSLECGAVEKSPDNGYWLRLTTSDEYDFIVDIEWRSGVLSMAEIDEGGEVFEAMKTRRAKIDESEIGPTVAGWLAEMIAEMKE